MRELNAADTLNVPALSGLDPSHWRCGSPSRCAAARRKQSPAPGKQPPAPVGEACAPPGGACPSQEERRYGGVSEGMIVLLTFRAKVTRIWFQVALAERWGWPSELLSRLAPRRPFSRSRFGSWLDVASLARWFSRSRMWVWLRLSSLVTLGLLVGAR